jgi:hypothetical protein
MLTIKPTFVIRMIIVSVFLQTFNILLDRGETSANLKAVINFTSITKILVS